MYNDVYSQTKEYVYNVLQRIQRNKGICLQCITTYTVKKRNMFTMHNDVHSEIKEYVYNA